MRSGSRASREGTRLLFAGGTVSPMMCPADGQQKDDNKGQTEDQTRKEKGRDKEAKRNRRPQQGGGFSLRLFLPGVLG